MEVHHHAHVGHHEKTWKEYFWEFLMLFLAVFCGFSAEYELEHIIEHQREHQYAQLLLSDLRSDSMYFINRNKLVTQRLKKHQEIYELITGSSSPSDKELINAFLPVFYTYDLNTTPATYSEMKSSGSLRYIRNQNLIKNLQEYYEVLIPRTNQSLALNNRYYENIIYPFFLHHIRIQDIDDEDDSVKAALPVIINRSRQMKQELLNITENYGSDLSHMQITEMPLLINKNIELIELLK